MLQKIIKLFNKTYSKTIFNKRYTSPIKHGYKPEHIVETYIIIKIVFDFECGLRYSIEVPNCCFTEKTLKKAFIRALEHESIGMSKYQQLKDNLQNENLYNRLDI